MAISIAVCEIFTITEWWDLENRVKVHSQSLEITFPTSTSHQLNTETAQTYHQSFLILQS